MLAPPLKKGQSTWARTLNHICWWSSFIPVSISPFVSLHCVFINSWAERKSHHRLLSVFCLLDEADLCAGFLFFWFVCFFNNLFVPQWSVLINVIKVFHQHEATEVHPGVLSVLFCPLSFVHQALLCLQQGTVLGSRTGTLLHHCSAPGGLTHSR